MLTRAGDTMNMNTSNIFGWEDVTLVTETYQIIWKVQLQKEFMYYLNIITLNSLGVTISEAFQISK